MKKRYLAGIIDFAISALIQSVLMFFFIIFPLVAGKLDSSQVIGLNLRITAVSMLYMLIRDNLGTKSIGKRIMKLYIVGTKTHTEAAFQFRFLRNVTWILGPLDVLVMLVAKKRIGDMLANTSVEEYSST